jgi:hypothetical protein
VKSCNLFFTNRGGLSNHLHVHRKPKATRQPTPIEEEHIAAEESDGNYSAPNTTDPSFAEPEDLPPDSSKETKTPHPLLNGGMYPLFVDADSYHRLS